MAVGSFPEHVAFEEGMRLNRLISAVLKQDDLFLRVRGSEEDEPTTGWTRDRAEIQAATATTDQTFYDVGRGEVQIGRFDLTFGLGSGVVSDWSWSMGSDGSEALMNQLAEI